MTHTRQLAAPIAQRAELDPATVVAVLSLVVQALSLCLSDPEKAAKWLRQDTPATRRAIRRTVRREWLARDGNPAKLPALSAAILDECSRATGPLVAALYADVGV